MAMLCQVCHGRHQVWRDGVPWPCPECGGAGELQCCEGLREQPLPTPTPEEPPQEDDAVETSQPYGPA
jgi:hypothetical protein